jgi:hypothetical protein
MMDRKSNWIVEIMIVGSHGDVDCMTEMLMDNWMETLLTEWLEL